MLEDVIKMVVMSIASAVVGGVATYIVTAHKLVKRVCCLEQAQRTVEQDIKNNAEEQQIVVTGVLACLKGLREQGCNGPVTRGIETIENYIQDRAHRLTHRE